MPEPQACNFIKKRLWNRCFPVNFVKFLRKPFFIEHLWWLLLILSTITDSRLNHFVMINIYNEVLDACDMKLFTKEFIKVMDFRIVTLGCINFEHLFALVHFLLFNSSSLCLLLISSEIIRKS